MTDDTPRQRLARTLGRRGLVAALITAAGVLAILLVQALLRTALSSVGLVDFGRLGEIGSSLVQQSLAADLPFAIGVFLALWQILPIAPELRFAHVVTRSLFAAGVGALAVFLVQAVLVLVLVGRALGFDDLGRSASDASRNLGVGILQVLQQSAVTWVELVPIVVLAGLLLWGFLQRFPPKHAVTGVADEL